jgi:hypothetical protein
MAEHSAEKPRADEVARKTLSLAQEKLGLIASDQAFTAAFRFLVLFSASTQAPRDESIERAIQYMGTNSEDTPLAVGAALKKWIATEAAAGSEYLLLASRSATRALVEWFDANNIRQQELFPSKNENTQVWRPLSNGAAFSDLSRLFFKEVVRTYLHYLLDRESSGVLRSIEDVSSLHEGLDRYAYETTKIAQSFSAGWYNKYAIGRAPTSAEVGDFVGYAIHKLRDELLREERAKA